MRSRRTTGALAVAIALLVSACGGSLAPRTGAPLRLGVNSDITWGIPRGQVSREVALIRRSQVGWVRLTVDLSDAEAEGAGVINRAYLRQIDFAVISARRAGADVLLELDRTPHWATADPRLRRTATGWRWNPYWRYRSAGDYARIVSDMVRHYARLGVSHYELWNEPNFPRFWPSGVDAAQYARLLKVTYPAVKAADRHATVVMGGLSNKDSYAYLQALYAAGARGSYDVANFHVYPGGDPGDCLSVAGRPWEGDMCLLQGLHAEMLRNHDDVPVWVTELGWSDCRTGDACVSAAQQAVYVRRAYRLLDSGEYAWVQNAFVYQMHDSVEDGTWANGLGMVAANFAPKPAFYALRTAALVARGHGTPAS